MSKIQAIILAGGQGSRLRPYTKILPKPLLPVEDSPICEIIIKQLKTFDITNIVISTGYLSELIEAYFGGGKKLGVKISYVKEKKPLGTAGAIKLVDNLEDDFLSINGDILTDLNFNELLRFHKKSKAVATITAKERIVKTDFGVIYFDKAFNLKDYVEKPEHRSFVSVGINAFNARCKKYIKSGEYIGIPDLMLRIKSNREIVKCFKTKSDWLDLGRHDDFEAAQEVFCANKNKFLKK